MRPLWAESDLVETFSRSSGPGGQNVNKVNTAVTLLHKPSGILVRVQSTRSQEQNRALARERLTEKLRNRAADKKARIKHEIELRRRQKRSSRRPRGVKERMLEGKKRRAVIKKQRGRATE